MGQFVESFVADTSTDIVRQINRYLASRPKLKIVSIAYAIQESNLFGSKALVVFEEIQDGN